MLVTVDSGVVLQIFKKMNDVRVEGERVTAQAGVLLSKVASAAYNASLTGLEFAAGIPVHWAVR